MRVQIFILTRIYTLSIIMILKKTLLILIAIVTFRLISIRLSSPPGVAGANFDNLIYLPGQPNRRRLSIRSESCVRRRCLMSTYEEFMIILATAGLIVAILNFAHKK